MNTTTYRGALMLGLALLIAPLSGCVSRAIVALDDHPERPLTMMTVQANKFVPLFGTGYGQQREFWLCSEQGDTLRCKRTCEDYPSFVNFDGEKIVCPGGNESVLSVNSEALGGAAGRGAAAQPDPGPAPTPEPEPTPDIPEQE